MSAYSDHALKCDTCSGFDDPGGRSYAVPARCARGTQLHAGQRPASTPTPKSAVKKMPVPTPKVTREPETFGHVIKTNDPDD